MCFYFDIISVQQMRVEEFHDLSSHKKSLYHKWLSPKVIYRVPI